MRRIVVSALVVVATLAFAPAAWADHDNSAPVVSYTLTGTAGTNNWFKSNVTINWSVSEPEGLISSTCLIAQLVTAEGTATYTCTATSHGGDATGRATLSIDKTAPTVSGATPARAPDANGWYNRPVTVAFAGTDAVSGIAGCAAPTYAGTDGAPVSVAGTCTDVAGHTSAAVGFALNYDATAPSVSVSPSRGPDANGWYNRPVAISASGSDATSGVAGCTSPSYSGPDSASAAVAATCTDKAGNTSGAATLSLKYDATPPSVTAKADRAPSAGWYRKPVTVSFAGADGGSGIAACTAPARYAGPDGEAASVKGACTDAAGNSAEAAHTFKYDATAPKLAKPKVEPGKKLVRIAWQRAPDFASAQIVRKPGLKGRKSSVVYRGKGASFADRAVVDGVRYRYELTVLDVAGNASGRAVTASPRGPLYRPTVGQRVRAAPLTLAWDAVPGARFYNVQLFRNGVKVLSAWPRKPTLRVAKAWRYARKTQRLAPGNYLWYVWPAQGTLERPIFGRPLGRSSFVVRGGS
jgi:hypothetical protein